MDLVAAVESPRRVNCVILRYTRHLLGETQTNMAGSVEEAMEINGIAHVMLTAGDFQRSREFYRQLLPFLGLRPVMDGPGFYYCVGGRTAFGIRECAPEHRGERFVQQRVGLHHVCFRARERDDVDQLHRKLLELGAAVVHAPQDDAWAPGYYSVLFEDPDGVRLELNHVPGQGLLKDAVPAVATADALP